jgi:hypothetical protein
MEEAAAAPPSSQSPVASSYKLTTSAAWAGSLVSYSANASCNLAEADSAGDDAFETASRSESRWPFDWTLRAQSEYGAAASTIPVPVDRADCSSSGNRLAAGCLGRKLDKKAEERGAGCRWDENLRRTVLGLL